MEKRMREKGLPLFSLESRRPVRDFDVLGFTLQYELLFTNVLTMLDLAGIPAPAQFQGRSLLRSHPRHEPRTAMGERIGPKGFQEWFLREAEWKLIATRRGPRLFHIPSDRLEQRDLSEQRPILTRYLTGLLWAGSPAFRETEFQAPPSERHLDDAQLEELEEAGRALGYIE
jgi:hypothetical protein